MMAGWGGAPNRIDTLGRKRGALICRIIGAKPILPGARALMIRTSRAGQGRQA
jgi:hypothetical protein